MKQAIKGIFPKVLVFITAILIWTLTNIFTKNLIPSPKNTFIQILVLLKDVNIYKDIFFTLMNILISMAISFLIAVAYVLVSLVLPNYVKQFTNPIVSTLLFIPAIIIVYICIIIFGYNNTSIYLVMVFVVSPVLITSFSSLPGQINKEYFKISRIYRLDMITTIKKIIIPQIMPLVSSAMNNGFSIAARIAILTEAIIGNRGIGYQIAYSFYLFDLEKVLALSIVSISLIYFLPAIIYRIYLGVNRSIIKNTYGNNI